MTRILAAALLAASTAPVFADGHVSEETMAKINALMEAMRCEINGEIEVEDDEIELDDVFCAGGQFDIELNEELHITGVRAE